VGEGGVVKVDGRGTPRRVPLEDEPRRRFRFRIARLALNPRRDVPLAILDLAVIIPCYLVPLVLRFDGSVPRHWWGNFLSFMPLVAVLHLLSNYLLGLYGQMWRYASVEEARRVVLAGVVGGALVVAVGEIWPGPRPLPLSVVIFGTVLSLLGFGAIRFQSRLFSFRRRSLPSTVARVLVVGAGRAGSLLLKDLSGNPSLGLDPVGVVDDDPRKLRLFLHGVPVLGTTEAIPSLVRRLQVDQVLLAMPSATSEVVRDVAALCEESEVTLRVLPSVHEIVNGRVTARDIRDLRIEDLLGRQQVVTDLDAVRSILQDRSVLVTGAGGSVGSEIARQVLSFGPSSLILLDHDETHLYDVVDDLNDHRIQAVLADIRERGRMIEIFMTLRPHVVFHAAAHKHVPMLESFPDEAVLTNVIGTANVVDAAVASGAARFVMISTDKAVRPASVMGATKWFGEQIVRSVDNPRSTFCAVRFGNVLGSRGSVIPTFLRQIGRGGPVTVTHPDMARYFMSLQEAVELVLQASALSKGGDVLTLEMGEPVNILDLARRLIRLSGRVPGRDVLIEIVGPRPGEKLVEDLVNADEDVQPTTHPGIVLSRPPVPDRPTLRRSLREVETLVHEGRAHELAERMKSLAESPATPLLLEDVI
jgi:FlaA1/EpsC-like NDP-sugar epimerase